MFRVRAVVLALVMALFVGLPTSESATADSESAAQAAAAARVLLIGDSITQGSTGDWTWRYRLAKHLGEAADMVGDNTGVYDPAMSSFDSNAYVDPAFDRDHQAKWGDSYLNLGASLGPLTAKYQPNVVVVHLGTNDLGWGGQTPEQVRARAQQALNDIRAAAPGTSVVFVALNPSWPKLVSYNNLLAGLVAETDLPAARVLLARADSGYVASQDTWDGVHPNAQGEAIIAAAVADQLAVLGIGSPYPRPLPTYPLGPRIPAILEASAGAGTGYLRWSGSAGSSGQIVWLRDLTQGTGWINGPVLKGTSTVLPNLANGHEYEAVLQPVKGWWASEVRSNPVRFRPMADIPEPVSTVSASSGDHAISASWGASPSATGYRMRVRDEAGTEEHIVQTAGVSATVAGLRAGVSYTVSVQPVGPRADGAWSAAVVVIPAGPSPVMGAIRGQARADGQLDLAWDAVPNATGYQVEMRAGDTWTVVSGPEPSAATALRLTGLAPGRPYDLRVSGWHQGIQGSAQQIQVRIPKPGAVRALKVRPVGGDRIRITGAKVLGADRYRLQVGVAESCRHQPKRWRWQGKAKAKPAVTLSGSAKVRWVRWRSMWDGNVTAAGAAKKRCIPGA